MGTSSRTAHDVLDTLHIARAGMIATTRAPEDRDLFAAVADVSVIEDALCAMGAVWAMADVDRTLNVLDASLPFDEATLLLAGLLGVSEMAASAIVLAGPDRVRAAAVDPDAAVAAMHAARSAMADQADRFATTVRLVRDGVDVPDTLPD